MFKNLDKKVKKLDSWDLGLTKLSVFSATLGLVSGWELFQNWAIGISWYWFIGAAIIIAILPLKHFFGK